FENQLERARSGGQRTIIVVAESEFASTLKSLKGKIRSEKSFRFGIVVVASDPGTFLKGEHTAPELLDAISDKDLKKPAVAEVHLLNALRQLLRLEAKGSSRVTQKMLERLNEIFIDLSAERNPQRLLATILVKAIDLTRARGGILYMVQ